jgi:hypothetical protein
MTKETKKKDEHQSKKYQMKKEEEKREKRQAYKERDLLKANNKEKCQLNRVGTTGWLTEVSSQHI